MKPTLVCLECHTSFQPSVYGSKQRRKIASYVIAAFSFVLAVVMSINAGIGEHATVFFMIMIPGAIISVLSLFVKSTVDYTCKACGTGRVIPSDSPRGKAILSKAKE